MSDRVTAPATRVLLVLLLIGIPAVAQIQFSRPKPAKPLPNPSIINSTRDEVLSMTKQMLEETSDTFAALDSHNRDIGNYELLLSNTGTSGAK